MRPAAICRPGPGLTVVLAVLLCAHAGGSTPRAVVGASVLQRVQADGVLVAGISIDSPPLAWQTADGTFAGYEVDLIAGLASQLGVQVNYVPLAGAARVTAVQAGRVHLTAAALTPSPEARRLVEFSTPYLHVAESLLVRQDSSITGAEDLAGRQVGLPRSGNVPLLRQLAPAAAIVSFSSCRAALPALLAGHIDAIACPEPVLELLLQRLARPQDLRLVERPLAPAAYALALPRGDVKWLQRVNAYLSRLAGDGRQEAMARRWVAGPEGRGQAATAPAASTGPR